MSASPTSGLLSRTCKPCEGGTAPLDGAAADRLLRKVEGWTLHEGVIERTFAFANFHQTMAFVNALAWIAHGEDHHPDLEVGYKTCKVRYTTHAIGGLSENDFICAAKINALVAGR